MPKEVYRFSCDVQTKDHPFDQIADAVTIDEAGRVRVFFDAGRKRRFPKAEDADFTFPKPFYIAFRWNFERVTAQDIATKTLVSDGSEGVKIDANFDGIADNIFFQEAADDVGTTMMGAQVTPNVYRQYCPDPNSKGCVNIDVNGDGVAEDTAIQHTYEDTTDDGSPILKYLTALFVWPRDKSD